MLRHDVDRLEPSRTRPAELRDVGQEGGPDLVDVHKLQLVDLDRPDDLPGAGPVVILLSLEQIPVEEPSTAD